MDFNKEEALICLNCPLYRCVEKGYGKCVRFKREFKKLKERSKEENGVQKLKRKRD